MISKSVNIHDVINTKEEAVTTTVMTIFEGKSMETKYSVLCYFINLYFCNYRLAIKIEECSHCDRSDEDQIKIQNTIEKQLGCKFIRINPDKKGFHMN